MVSATAERSNEPLPSTRLQISTGVPGAIPVDDPVTVTVRACRVPLIVIPGAFGVTGGDGELASLLPTALRARTVNV